MARYRMLVTPRGSTVETDIGDRIHRMGKISSTIDQADFLIGVSSINSVRIQCLSEDGLLSESGLFKNGKGGSLAKILIDDIVLFSGVISEDGTSETDTKVEFLIMSIVGLMKNETADGSIYGEGVKASEIIRRILRSRSIRDFIGDLDIQPEIDVPLDNTEPLVGQSMLKALNNVLAVSNSFLIADHDQNIRVSGRTAQVEPKKTFYGPHSAVKEPSILRVRAHNEGTNRILNRVTIGRGEDQIVAEDRGSIQRYGQKEKAIQVELVRNRDNAARVAFGLLRAFRLPRREVKIEVPTKDTAGIFIGDIIKVDYPKRVISRVKPADRYDEGLYGKALYSTEQGLIRIDSRALQVVYERHDNPTNFTTEFKIRER